MKAAIAVLLLASFTLAAEPLVRRDAAYSEPKTERQTLDVYSPAEGRNHPIVFWIHGGGWRRGDKTSVQRKPQAFTDKGFVFAATNYRFAPDVTVKEMTGDIAKAIRWVHDHARDFGGDPEAIYVMGHSAGAHLAALVCTDDRYLQAEGLSLSLLKGCVPVDVSAYDIPKRLQDLGTSPPAAFKEVFSEQAETQRELSPVMHVTKGKSIPPFLILHVADRPETTTQSKWFASKLSEAGVSANVVAAEGKNHGTINADLGLPEDPPTKALFSFLTEQGRRNLSYAEPRNARQTLDVYAPAKGQRHPIVFWIHGGGWQRGDKTEVQMKPQAFVDRGYVFASTNYRFVPNVTIREMAGDIAQAMRYVHDHAEEYSGDPQRFVVMGHSAGAQLAALVCTDESYLQSAGLSLSIVKGCVPVDGDTYDVPLQIATVEQRRKDAYGMKFGDEGQQRVLSPITHVMRGRSFPPVLILHVADHPETKLQSERLVAALRTAGYAAQTHAAAGKDHTTINADLGKPGDEPTQAVFEFLDEALKAK